jgi:hypothetical protein
MKRAFGDGLFRIYSHIDLVVWNIFIFHILGIMIPTDFHILQRVETTNQHKNGDVGDMALALPRGTSSKIVDDLHTFPAIKG